jgi:DNA-binding beta-propeller fold protein YncE
VVAEAGRHRLWRVGPGGFRELAAGTGEESLEDGRASEALLAQPSGLAVTNSGVLFVDAESSALRVLTDDARVVTLVGHGLFEWGRADGPTKVARLQHPLGVAAVPASDVIYVADTFNSMLRVWEGKHEMLRALPVDGLDEPGGLDVLPDGRLVVADTNHHRVVIVNPQSGAVMPLLGDESGRAAPEGEALWIGPGQPLRLPFHVALDGDTLDGVNGPPVRIAVEAEPGTLLADGPRRWAVSTADGSVELTTGTPGEGTLTVEIIASTSFGEQCTTRQTRRRHRLTVRADL